MKTAIAIVLCFFIIGCNSQKSGESTSTGAKGDSVSTVKLSTKRDTLSYTIGMMQGKNLKMQTKDIDVDVEMIAQGLRDGFSGRKAALTDEQGFAAVNQAQKDIAAKRESDAKGAVEKGKTFLAENGKKEGVITTATGLQYKVLKAGSGKKPKQGDEVTVNYAGKLLDGTEFDNSAKRGGPATFKVGQVIPGWNEALALMPVGSKWELYIPPDLAYGERGTPGGPIPPNATLIFEVELLSVK